MHTKHHSAAYRAVNAALMLALTVVIYVNRKVHKWMMS